MRVIGIFIFSLVVFNFILGVIFVPYDGVFPSDRPDNFIRAVNDFFEVGVGNGILVGLIIVVSTVTTYLVEKFLVKGNDDTKEKTITPVKLK